LNAGGRATVLPAEVCDSHQPEAGMLGFFRADGKSSAVIAGDNQRREETNLCEYAKSAVPNVLENPPAHGPVRFFARKLSGAKPSHYFCKMV
jgi:hypothetical protein